MCFERSGVNKYCVFVKKKYQQNVQKLQYRGHCVIYTHFVGSPGNRRLWHSHSNICDGAKTAIPWTLCHLYSFCRFAGQSETLAFP